MENILQLNRLIKEEIIMEQNDVINDINENFKGFIKYNILDIDKANIEEFGYYNFDRLHVISPSEVYDYICTKMASKILEILRDNKVITSVQYKSMRRQNRYDIFLYLSRINIDIDAIEKYIKDLSKRYLYVGIYKASHTGLDGIWKISKIEGVSIK